MTYTPLQRYQRDLQMDGFAYDPAQEAAVHALQEVYDRLLAVHQEGSGNWLASWRERFSRRPKEPVEGLYMWGGVGRGKTYLMDNFYESLPFRLKRRSHFHRFMRMVHEELRTLDGERNPLEKVADRIAADTRVLCFDEFFVSDITDAMILGTLLGHLFERGVTLVATSNIAPDGLYRDGLQRQRFLPAIELLKRHTRVLNVDGGTDYRLRALTRAEIYHSPLGSAAEAGMKSAFLSLVPEVGEVRQGVSLEIELRRIATRYVAEDVVWFDFMAVCDGPRSQNDYIELAREYHAVLVSDVPQMGRSNDDQARRFINLVDEFYDRNVKLIVSAAVPLDGLYTEGKLSFEFERTRSRLLEMQSTEYLARAHRP